MGNGLGALNVLESKTLADLIYDAVRNAILSGELLPGSRLRETELANRMHVSRTPVREALCRLESEGMIEYIPRRGMIIRGLYYPGNPGIVRHPHRSRAAGGGTDGWSIAAGTTEATQTSR